MSKTDIKMGVNMRRVYDVKRLAILKQVAEVLSGLGVGCQICEQTKTAMVGSSVWDRLELKFVTEKKMMGAMIKSLHEGTVKCSCPCQQGTKLDARLRWSGNLIRAKPFFASRNNDCVIGRLLKSFNNDESFIALVNRGGIKSLRATCNSSVGNKVINLQLQPMAGTISVIYFPPVPPFTVNLHEEEIKSCYLIFEQIGNLLIKNLIVKERGG
ncbi:hypothetical protein IT084_06220 [Desulfallas sp. Bu1-1]|uniref:hypothetical protein n=1 Tax=Desulfallas sp. Bu1-1 TaxID=2787620 RepID=UPI00189F03A3|nr:hypothetical protein [Desulfallas sp. Bu1-1]MBF7082574.1 hypothetical protein [Desulfallas sp. Bu1-1]